MRRGNIARTERVQPFNRLLRCTLESAFAFVFRIERMQPKREWRDLREAEHCSPDLRVRLLPPAPARRVLTRQPDGCGAGRPSAALMPSAFAPPDGVMADYMASLERLRDREDAIYWPGHGGPVRDPRRYVRGLVTHRRQRNHQTAGLVAERDGRECERNESESEVRVVRLSAVEGAGPPVARRALGAGRRGARREPTAGSPRAAGTAPRSRS